MQAHQYQQRKLNDIEQAFALANQHYPFCVVCVLHINQVGELSSWQSAINELQLRHVLLRCIISKHKQNWWFQEQPVPPVITIQPYERIGQKTWRSAAEKFLNTQFGYTDPLMKVGLIKSQNDDDGELIICFHHAMVDGYYARLILDEILCIAARLPLQKSNNNLLVNTLPVPQARSEKTFRFFLRQLKTEWQYRIEGNTAKVPSGNHNGTISLQLTKSQSSELITRAASEGITLNSLLLSAMCSAVLNRKYASGANPVSRIISFADMRAIINPSNGNEYPGCLVTMLRSDIRWQPSEGVVSAAKRIHHSLTRSGLRGEPLRMFRISKRLMRIAIALKKQRLGVAALSFLGHLNLERQYGHISLQHVTAFVTNNQIGPQLSAFGKILHGKLSLDFTYLTTETSEAEANEMVEDISVLLEALINKTYI